MEAIIEKIKKLPYGKLEEYLRTLPIDSLHRTKLHLDDIYYNTDESEIPDERYDILKDVLINLDPESKVPVGAKIREEDNEVELPFFLGGADKITPNDEKKLERWLSANPSEMYILSEKLDGISCLLTYDGENVRMFTRGDGSRGKEISYLYPYFTSIPRRISEPINVRGELIMKKSVFEKKYKDTPVNGRIYKNKRNLVSGCISGKTARAGLEDIMFVTYEILDNRTVPSQYNQLKKLKELNFHTVKFVRAKKLSIHVLTQAWRKLMTESSYELDGIVVQPDLPYDSNIDGNPDYMFAFKIQREENIFTTTVLSIEWKVSKHKQIKPVVIVEPVDTGEIEITRATAHNAKYVVDNSLGPGAIIKITRSKEVIPYILEIVKPADEPSMPEIPYVWDDNKVNLIATEGGDEEACIKLISSFFSSLGIKYVSEATVKKLYNHGFDTLKKILLAKVKDLKGIPGLGEKSAERIVENIRNGLKNSDVPTVIGASGIFGNGIGVRKINALVSAIPDIFKREYSPSILKKKVYSVEGFADKTTDKIVTSVPVAIKFLEMVNDIVVIPEREVVSNSLSGQIFVFTGFRDKELEKKITERGGKVTGSVSKKTNGLIVKSKESEKESSKFKKAVELNVEIYTIDEFNSTFLSD